MDVTQNEDKFDKQAKETLSKVTIFNFVAFSIVSFANFIIVSFLRVEIMKFSLFFVFVSFKRN